MAITFPRELPGGVAQQTFEIQRVDYQAPEEGGRIGGVQAGFPLWMASWTIGNTTAPMSDGIEVFLDSMRGSQRTMYGRDWRRPYPLAHIDGFSRMRRIDGTPFTGAGGSWSQSIDDAGNALLTITAGLPSGLVLSPLDYIDFRWDAAGSAPGTGDRRALVRVMEKVMVDAAGAVTVTVEPPVPTIVPSDAVPHLDLPACVMKLTKETKKAAVDRRQRIKGTVIVAVQDLRA